MQGEETEASVKSRTVEEEDNRTKQEDARKGSLKKEGDETRGDTDEKMDVHMMEEEEFQERKKDRREQKLPLAVVLGVNWKRIAQPGEARSLGGKCHIRRLTKSPSTTG